jgi:GTP cyclohydrolase II
LCLDDAMALISVFSSVPRAIQLENIKYDGYIVDKAVLEEVQEEMEDGVAAATAAKAAAAAERGCPNESSSQHCACCASCTGASSLKTQRHQNFAQKFSKTLCKEVRDTQVASRYSFIAETGLPTRQGRFRVRAYRNDETGAEPLAMVVGDVEGRSDVIVRVHDQCLTSEVFGSLKCDCKEQLDYALEYIQSNEGIVLYLPQEGRGIGLANKVAAYAAQETGLDTVDANRHLGLPDDAREYDSVRDILADLNIKSIRLLSNNPRKFACLQELGVVVSERLPCVIVPNSEYSMKYVHSKAERMGHMINVKTVSSEFLASPASSPKTSSPRAIINQK